MALSRESRKMIEGGDLAGVEDQWLERLSATPIDLAYFAGVARALGGSGEETLAAELLELLDEHLSSEEDWERRLELLRQAGHLMRPNAEKLHKEILATLHRLHPDTASRDGLIELVGLHRAPGDIPKTWEKVKRFRALIQFEVGTVVLVEGKGAGRVVEVNLELSKLKIDLDGAPTLSVGLAAAGKLLTVLPESHFLRRKLEDPEAIRRLAEEDSAALLAALLESHGEPMAAGDVRQALAGAVAPEAWSSWWSAARNHPQLVVSGKGARQRYGWAASSADATGQVLAAFEGAPTLEKKLGIFRREAKRGDETRDAMAELLAAEGRAAAGDEPARALAVWSALEKAGATPAEDDWSPAALIRGSADPAAWLAAIDDRALRSAAGELVRAERDDWTAVYSRWLRREAEPRLLSQLATALGTEAPGELDSFFDDVLAHPRRHEPAFVWLVETLAERELATARSPLRLLQLVIESPAKARDTKMRGRLKKAMADGPVLSHLLKHVDADQAAQSEELIKRAPVPDYLRDQLRTQLQMRFPDLQESEVDLLYALESSIEIRRRQLKELLEEEIPANRRAIEEARALGDLRENFEYKSARQRHEYLSARVSRLEGDLTRARPIDLDAVDPSRIRIGTVATLRRGGDQRQITILGPWESDPDRGVVSYEADTARQLIGKEVGDPVELDGDEWSVDAIGRAAV